jgi:hypothetical protein
MVKVRSSQDAWRFSVDKPFTVVGTIRRGEESGSWWWYIESDDLPLRTELSGLDSQFQCEGLRVALTGHFETERLGAHVHWMLLFVDDVIPA